MLWLLEPSCGEQVRAAIKAGQVPTAAQQIEYEAAWEKAAAERDGPEGYTVVGNRAGIAVRGMLTDRPSLFARWFGGGNTTYGDIVAGLRAAEADPAVTDVDLDVDSPGGTATSGWLEAMEAVRDMAKPVHARIGNMATSAAYGLASLADDVWARNRMSYIGSVGVALTAIIFDDEISVTSSNAPDKRPDLTTEEGRATIQKELDAIHDVFVEMIATGRNTTAAKVNKEYGRGATLLAAEAVTRGMIDGVGVAGSTSENSESTAHGGKTERVQSMTLDDLKAQHPTVYAAAVAEGEKKGAEIERDRVEAFLEAGEYSGDMKTAMEAVRDGSQMTAKFTNRFMIAAASKGDQNRRGEDEGDAARAAGKSAPTKQKSDAEAREEEAASLVEEQFGIQAEGAA